MFSEPKEESELQRRKEKLILLHYLWFNSMTQKLNRQKKTCQEIWDAANTIHLYASLSEEETQSKDLKVKQSEIRQLSEKIISLSNNRV